MHLRYPKEFISIGIDRDLVWNGDILPEGWNGVTGSLVDIASTAQRLDGKDPEGSLLP